MAAAKHPGPFWRKQTNCYYVQIGKKQHRLSTEKGEAYRLYHELMSRSPEEPEMTPARTGLFVVQVVDDFLEWAKCNRAAATYDIYNRLLQKFAEAIPKTLAVAEVKPYHVTRVMDANSAIWSENTKRDFAVTVQRAFNWAEKQGLLEKNPLRHVEKPAREARELAVSPVDLSAILAAVGDPSFRDLIELAWETGVTKPVKLGVSEPESLRA
jgi:hypothetical protein